MIEYNEVISIDLSGAKSCPTGVPSFTNATGLRAILCCPCGQGAPSVTREILVLVISNQT